MSVTQQPPSAVERLYALDGGDAVAPNKSMYSPGIDKGIPVALSCNAYLIRRAGEWILWDTGLEDNLYFEQGGKVVAHNIRGIVTRPIAAQLHELGLLPGDIRTVLLSHAHFDHVGNCNMFPEATFYLQAVEHAAMFGPHYNKYGYVPNLYAALKKGKVELLAGDTDLFGDGSMHILFTPGHTPGHSSLLVNLQETGPVLLTADVAHYRYNLEHRLVPEMNSDKQQSLDSMDKLERIAHEQKAELWFNHDIRQNATIPHSPSWFA